MAGKLMSAQTTRGSGKHPNSHAREVALQAIYQQEIANTPVHEVLEFRWLNEPLTPPVREYCIGLITGVTDHWEALDDVIKAFSHKHITQISVINRCILRTAIYELMQAQLDPAIIMDDALNLTRKYDGEDSVAFVNGILDPFEKERRNADRPE